MAKPKTLYMALKAGANKVMPARAEEMANLTNSGAPCHVVKSLDDAITFLRRYAHEVDALEVEHVVFPDAGFRRILGLLDGATDVTSLAASPLVSVATLARFPPVSQNHGFTLPIKSYKVLCL